jgi:ankyrin repeat protein
MSSDAEKQFYDAVMNDKLDVIETMVKNKEVDVNYKFPEHDSKTAAHIAASKMDIKMLELLISLQANLKEKDRFDQVPIENAACHYNYDLIKFLLTKVPEHAELVQEHINDPAVEEFFIAIREGDIEKARTMLTEGKVDVDAPNKSDYNNTALHTACDLENMEMVKMLVDEFSANMDSENISEEIPIITTCNDDIVEFLLSRGSRAD